MRLKHKVIVQIAQDTSMELKRFYLEDATVEVVIDTFENQISNEINIAALGSDALSLGSITDAKGLYIEVNGACRVYLNGSSDYITMDPVLTGESGKPAKLFLEADITSVTVENTDDTDALTGSYCVWGDPAS